jgi:anti-sigma B factor antagonist
VLAVPLEPQDTYACSAASQAALPGSDYAIVVLPAEIDIANASRVSADLLAAIGAGDSVIIADLSGCSFCDCAGVEALLDAAARAVLAGAQLRPVAKARAVLRVFELTGLTSSLRVYPTRSAALEDVAGA